MKRLAFRRVAVAFDADTAGDAAAPRLIGDLRSFGALVERWRPTGVKDWNDLLLVHGAEVLSRDLADDQVDDIAALEQPAPTVTAEDVENDEVVVNDGADEVLAARQATDPGSIEIRDPVTGEWFEIEAASCPPSWRPVALRETHQRELWDHPP